MLFRDPRVRKLKKNKNKKGERRGRTIRGKDKNEFP